MTSLEKKECIENLKCLGVFTTLGGPTSSAKPCVEEFSFDVPNFAAFPLILHSILARIDAKECRERFKDCWPFDTKTDRVKFRKAALAWLQQIKKMELHGTIPDFSSIFEMPFGDRYVKFLLKLSTFALRKECQTRGDVTATEGVDRTSCISGASTESTSAVDHETENSSLEVPTKATDDFRNYASSLIQSFTNALAKEKDMMQKQRDVLCKRLLKVASRLKINQQIVETGNADGNLTYFADEVIQKAKRVLQKYGVVWDNLAPLLQRAREFDRAYELAVGEKVTISGISIENKADACDLLQDVFTPNGRLDIFQLVKAVQSSIHVVRTMVDQTADATDFSTLYQEIIIPRLLVQEQEQLLSKLNILKEGLLASTKSLRKDIAEAGRCSIQPASPSCLCMPPVCRFKPWPEMECIELHPFFDWSQTCSFDDTTSSFEDSACGSAAEDSIKTPEVTDAYNGFDRSGDQADTTRTVCRVAGTQVCSLSTTEWNSRLSKGTVPMQPATTRKFRLSVSPLSTLSSLGSSSLNPMDETIGTVHYKDGGWTVPERSTDTISSFSNGSVDSSTSDSIQSHRRLSVRMNRDLLKIFEADEEETVTTKLTVFN